MTMRIGLGLLSALSVFIAVASSAAPRDEDEAMIRAIDASWSQALHQKDLNGVMENYSTDAVFLTADQPLIRGHDAIRAWFAKRFATPGYSATFAPTHIVVARSGEIAYELGSFRVESLGADNQTMVRIGKHLVAWKKDGNVWRVAAESINVDGPAVSAKEAAAVGERHSAAASSERSITAMHVAFFTGEWQGTGKFADGRTITARVNAHPANSNGALIYVHDDEPPSRFHSTALWAARDGSTLSTEANSSGGFRVFVATEVTDTRIAFISRGQLSQLLNAMPNSANKQERVTYEITSPNSYKMTFEAKVAGGPWRLVDSIDFKRRRSPLLP
ncbi:hypothetical protein LYSHEL_21730 [Lysobacter helvus]|uniref:DUF4440 domain-containing protein n=2 Tax=Lysobacteraceae TaxID=32033 RepID=A0ABN6FW06_9GAMM|nr:MULTISPECIES: DUF4440 domain-containing protein [Lysobacter]BCT93150.1 hypothetical protein LYSCAS_21740 [Lysobacter caseinilyticus]BCT96302.1 hypothetical protein LYSHEL_21730 [Lysobacter helvus]